VGSDRGNKLFFVKAPEFLRKDVIASILSLVPRRSGRYSICDTLYRAVSQTSFGHISINFLTILTVSIAMESPQKDLSINASHISRQSILAKISGRSIDNYYSTVY